MAWRQTAAPVWLRATGFRSVEQVELEVKWPVTLSPGSRYLYRKVWINRWIGSVGLRGRHDIDRDIERLAVLEDQARRALYGYVTRQGDFVSRDQAASAIGIARGLAAFHLDKLADEGLLEVVYRRPPGRAGPGAGRPAKLYRRSRHQINITLPPRNYEMLARLLAQALDPEVAPAGSERLQNNAHRAGTDLAGEARGLAGRRPNRRRLLEAALEVLWRQGFEPSREDGDVVLRNCPFEAAAREYPDVVCAMNLALMKGLLDELNVSGMTAILQPREGLCCVTLRAEPPGAA
jgi:predicted ArsR family transcriptional regulator